MTGQPAATLKVLVVDDTEEIRTLLGRLLKSLGCAVALAGDGRAALAEAASGRPDLIFMDLHMPNVSGDEACRLLRADPGLRDIPVVMLTGADSPAEVMQSWRAGADDFLPKPVRLTQLRAKVDSVRAGKGGTPAKLNQAQSLLLVDDSRFFRSLLGGGLEHSGFKLLYAASGQEALDQLDRNSERVSAALIDMVMPGLSGLDLLKALRKHVRFLDRPALLMTAGEVQPSWVDEAKSLGASCLSKKTMPVEAIIAEVRNLFSPELAQLRAAERVPFFSVVHYRAAGAADGEWQSGFAYNVSTQGIFVRTLSALPRGTALELQVKIGVRMNEGTRGEVVWANGYGPRSSFSAPIGMGIRFVKLSADDQEAVRTLVVGRGTPPPA